MRDQPPPALAALLLRLGVAFRGHGLPKGRIFRRTSGDPAVCEPLWIDTLLRTRRLTPFQATEIYAGRGEDLRLGPYVLLEKIAGPLDARHYRARHFETGVPVRLTVLESFPPNRDSELEKLRVAWGPATYRETGREGNRAYLAAPWHEGRTAAEWVIHQGRFPPTAVLEIARSTAAQLAAWEREGRGHGDICTQTLLLNTTGEIALLTPGLRGLLRGAEGFSCADLAPETYKALAPERGGSAEPPTMASDIYACGCVWWHLLSGRSPLPGGDSLTKLRSVQTAAIADVRRHAPDTPEFFAHVISACLQPDPRRRPSSMDRLAEQLGPPTPAGKILLRTFFRRSARPSRPGRQPRRFNPLIYRPARFAGLAVAGSILLLVLGPWIKNLGHTRNQNTFSNQGVLENQPPGAPVGSFYVSSGPVQPGSGKNASEKIGRDLKTDHAGKNQAKKKLVDDRLLPVVFTQRPAANDRQAPVPPDFILTPENVSPGREFRLEPGQRAIGKSGRRIRLTAAKTGILISGENIRFENVDFVAAKDAGSSPAGTESALVVLHSRCVEFRGCTFRQRGTGPICRNGLEDSANTGNLSPFSGSAVRWEMPPGADAAEDRDHKIKFTNCVFHRVSTGIDCRLPGPIHIEAKNILFLGPREPRETIPHLGFGSWLFLHRLPQSGELVLLRFRQATFRESGPVLTVAGGKGDRSHLPERPDQPSVGARFCEQIGRVPFSGLGEITIEAEACVFALLPHAALLSFSVPDAAEVFANHFHWTGAGSLVPPGAVIARYTTLEGEEEPLDDADLSIAGLVRSRIEFAGSTDLGVEAQQILHWQAPIASPDPPGALPEALPRCFADDPG